MPSSAVVPPPLMPPPPVDGLVALLSNPPPWAWLLILALLLSLIAPSLGRYWRVQRSRGVLMRMLTEDIRQRTGQAGDTLSPLQLAIHYCRLDPRYQPLIYITRGVPAPFDWQREKWLLPEHRAADILAFYNATLALEDAFGFLFGKDFPNGQIARERKIAHLEALLQQLDALVSRGNRLLTLLEADGWG